MGEIVNPDTYNYFLLKTRNLPPGELAQRIRRWASHEGADILGLFVPQLGWANDEAALLARGSPPVAALVGGDDAIAVSQHARMAPTVRPAGADRPAPGGVYVHRWFEVEARNVDEFVELSSNGWKSFETLFDARIFGLFRAADAEDGLERLLLITRYGSHGVWEASRDPTTDAMQIFLRRQQLTRRTWAASTRLITTG